MSESPRPLFAWPGWDDLRATTVMAAQFVIFFYIFYGLAAYVVDVIPYKYDLGLAWESKIPFIPETAIIYTSMSLMMILSLFIIRDKQRVHELLKVLCLQVLIGTTVFVVFPVVNHFPEINRTNDLPVIYVIADVMNFKNNNFPSLHICFSVTMAIIFSGEANPWQALIFKLWALAIIISTFTLYEHGLADTLSGCALGLWGVSRWRKADSHIRTVQAEIQTLDAHSE